MNTRLIPFVIRLSRYLLGMILVQISVCTGHAIVLFVRLVRGFTTHNGLIALSDLSRPEHVAEEALYFVNVSARFTIPPQFLAAGGHSIMQVYG